MCTLLTCSHAEARVTHPVNPFDAWRTTKRLFWEHVQHGARILACAGRQSDDDGDFRVAGAAIRSRLKNNDYGKTTVQLRVKQVRAKDTVESL